MYNLTMSGPENNTSPASEADKTTEEGEAREMQDKMIMDAAENHAAKITVVDAVKVAEEKAAKIIADAVKVAEEKAAGVQQEAKRVAAEASTNVHSNYTYSGTRDIVDTAHESSSLAANLSASKWHSPFMFRRRAITPRNAYRSKCLRLSSIPLRLNCKALSSLRNFVLLLTFLLRR